MVINSSTPRPDFTASQIADFKRIQDWHRNNPLPKGKSSAYANMWANAITDNKKFEIILQAVSDATEISKEAILGRRRFNHEIMARHLLRYLLRKQTRFGFKAIGERTGNADHSSVMHSCKVWQDLLDTDSGCRKMQAEAEAVLAEGRTRSRKLNLKIKL